MSDQIVVSENMLASLKATSPWVKFIAVVAFLFIWAVIVAGFDGTLPATGGLRGVVEFLRWLDAVAGLAWTFLCVDLFRYGTLIGEIESFSQVTMDVAIRQQKAFWKFAGILAVVTVLLYGAGFVPGIIEAAPLYTR